MLWRPSGGGKMTETAKALHQAMQKLSARCDFANQQDGAGFNKPDSHAGHALAKLPPELWSSGDIYHAWEMLRKYRRQLLGIGVNYDEIPEPEASGNTGRVVFDGERLIIRFAYDAAIKDDLKETIPGRRWEPNTPGKPWSAPTASLDAVLEFSARHGFDIEEERIREQISQQAQKPENGEPKNGEPEDADPGPLVPTIRIKDGLIAIYFPYTKDRGQFLDWVARVKALPERIWQQTWDKKPWTIPSRAAGAVVQAFPEAKISPEVLEMDAQAQKLAALSDKAQDTFEIPGIKGEPMPYQRAGVRFLEMAGGRGILADQMGLGKTLQSLGYLQLHPELRPALIVVPASLKINWAREINKWLSTEETVEILSGTRPDALPPASIWIINYDILPHWQPLLAQAGIEVMIADEAHYLKSGNRTKRGKAVFGHGRQSARIPGLGETIERVILLTGTPLLNRPKELFPLLNLIAPDAWPNFFRFAMRYCDAYRGRFGWDFSGASNLDELHEVTRPYIMRRTKDQVLRELPAKRRATVEIELTRKGRRAYDEKLAQARERISAAREAGEPIGAEHLTMIEHTKQAAVAGKMDQAKKWITDFLETGEKLIVFVTHKFVAAELMEEFGETAVKVTGDDAQADRQTAVDRFQNEDAVRLFVGNIKAAGVGLTLTAASNVAFLEFGWTPGEMEQAEDRAHRIGQEDAVTCWYLAAHNTIDMQIIDLLEEKRQVVDVVTDGKAGKLRFSGGVFQALAKLL